MTRMMKRSYRRSLLVAVTRGSVFEEEEAGEADKGKAQGQGLAPAPPQRCVGAQGRVL